MEWHELEGKLRIRFVETLNKAKQRPIIIEFQGPGSMRLEIFGVRYIHGNVLDSAAVLPGGKVFPHTCFTGELRTWIENARKSELSHEKATAKAEGIEKAGA